jgi:hypothetical protein
MEDLKRLINEVLNEEFNCFKCVWCDPFKLKNKDNPCMAEELNLKPLRGNECILFKYDTHLDN